VLLPSLHDHHVHILATAARRQSVNLAGLRDEAHVFRALQDASGSISGKQWLRAVDYDERAAGIPDQSLLDRWIADRPMRLQDRTGALWVLNTRAMAALTGHCLPHGAERDDEGLPNGRFWREDQWLRDTLGHESPDLSGLSRQLSACGVTGVTDAGANNGPAEADLLGIARKRGEFRQRLVLMGRETLKPGPEYELGALKLMLDEHDLPQMDELVKRILAARSMGRPVAAHCVTRTELAWYLTALELAGGARPGDRVEHGALISPDFIDLVRGAKLTVVSNPVFIADRGERYRATIPPDDWPDLYRLQSLLQAGVPLLAGSDSPYGDIDPWRGMAAAQHRRCGDGVLLGEVERLTALTAYDLWRAPQVKRGNFKARLVPGARADLILCSGTLRDILTAPSARRVQMTLVAGEIVFDATETPVTGS
jgi:predicted amidohydrolase YtcJ